MAAGRLGTHAMLCFTRMGSCTPRLCCRLSPMALCSCGLIFTTTSNGQVLRISSQGKTSSHNNSHSGSSSSNQNSSHNATNNHNDNHNRNHNSDKNNENSSSSSSSSDKNNMLPLPSRSSGASCAVCCLRAAWCRPL